ncbi:hypothetical protein [Anaerolentibacter hominis]|uniref:hypothetical protein n=1 Tax=Anaerolentibacter hominis TaxID=3079009 RepID=UPI0031B854CF
MNTYLSELFLEMVGNDYSDKHVTDVLEFIETYIKNGRYFQGADELRDFMDVFREFEECTRDMRIARFGGEAKILKMAMACC